MLNVVFNIDIFIRTFQTEVRLQLNRTVHSGNVLIKISILNTTFNIAQLIAIIILRI